MAQDTSRGNPNAGADSDTPAQRTVGSQIRAVPGDQQDISNFFRIHDDKGYVFEGDLRSKLASRCPEFHTGLYTFLAIGCVEATWDYSGSTWRLTGGTLDAVQETVVRAKFSGSKALGDWADLRNKIYKILHDGPQITVVELSDADTVTTSRGAFAKITARTIHANPRDMTGCTAVAVDPTIQDAIGRSFDGFWQIFHETVHITDKLLVDVGGTASDPGEIEDRLNAFRTAFSLPLRTSYYHPPSKKPGIEFTGGDIFWP